MSNQQNPGAPAGGRHQRRLRNLLIDKDYQLRYTLISVLVAAVICGGLGTLVIWQTRQANVLFKSQRAKNSKLIHQTRSNATKDVKKLLRVATDMLGMQLLDKDELVREGAKKAMADLKDDDAKIIARRTKEDQEFTNHRAQADKEMGHQAKKKELILIIGIVAFGIIFLVVIFIYNIIITHRVAGPLFKMGRLMDEVREGKYSEIWDLRKGDQLVEFFGRFKAMHTAIKERVRRDVELMDAALAACEKAGVSDKAIDALKERLAEKKVALGDKEA